MARATLVVARFALAVGAGAFVPSTISSSRRVEASTALSMAKIGVFFGTSTGSTEEAADLIVAVLGEDIAEGPIEIDSIQGSVAAEFSKHDALICGTPTWNTGADTERSGTGWDEIYYGEMQDINLQGKKVAVFGLGDSVSYCENYSDATGELHDVLQNLGATMMGYTSQEGYEHEDSKAIRGDKFCGLLLDAVNQEDLTPERVKNWVAQLKEEGILEGSTSSDAPAAAVEESIVMESTTVNGLSDNSEMIAQLEQENAVLRSVLNENSQLLDETISVHSTGSSFTPHYNPKTQRTMFVSPDGRKCYYSDSGTKMKAASP